MRLVVGTEIVEKKDLPVWITIALSITKEAQTACRSRGKHLLIISCLREGPVKLCISKEDR